MNIYQSLLLRLSLLFCPLSYLSVSAQTWQQQVDIDIRVALDDQTHSLDGDIRLTYHNNSPDTLEFVWMHLWPNAYRNGQTAMAKQHYRDGDMFMFYAMSRDLGGIDSLAFSVGSMPLVWQYHPEHIDIAKVILPEPLAQGQSVEISTPFRVDIPSGSISRLGHVGESYQITQWFPKPAVYDEDGWHPMPYLSQGEFFSEYGSYDVRITLPSNYTVGATGDYVPGSEDNEMELKRLAQLVEETEAWVTSEGWIETTNDFPASSSVMKTLHFRQSRIHDFAWFADKRYKVLQGEVTLPGDGRSVNTWAMFTPAEGELWQNAPEYLHDATYYYSLWNGDYPYNQVTAVDGTISAGGGMEYPNVTVIGSSGSPSGLETVIVHEVGHNWFYGILGSNEREHAWMDEGINSFNETRYLLTKYGTDKDISLLLGENNLSKRFDLEKFQYKWIDELSYMFLARLGADQPMQCHSNSLTSLNYGAIIYKKTAAAFAMLQSHLGQARFDAAMRMYFDTWKFRHPAPEDLQAVMEKSTGEDLSWFFEEWVQTIKRNNLKLVSTNAKLSQFDNSPGIVVRNVGELSSPARVSGLVGDSTVAVLNLPLMAPGEVAEVPRPPIKVDRWVVDYERVTLDYNRKDNTRHSGLFGGIEPLQLRMLTRLEDPERTQLFWVPALGWNHFDGFMIGTTLHNSALPWRDVTWRWTPMLSRDRFDDGLHLRGMLAVEGRHGDLRWALKSRRFGATEFLSELADVADTELNPEPLTRTSLGLMYRLNASPTSPFDANLSVELIHIDGFADSRMGILEPPAIRRMAGRAEVNVNHRLESLPGARQSLSLQSTVVQHDGVVEGYLIEPPSTTSTTNRVFDAWYHLERTVPSMKREKKWSVDARIVTVEGWNQFGAAPAGSQASFDPLGDALLLHRGADTSSGSWLSRQAGMERGGLPLNLVASRGFTSLRAETRLPLGLPISVQAGGALARTREWGIGAPVSDRLHLVASGCIDLGPVRVSIPIWTYEAGKEVWGPEDRWCFSLNLLKLNPWDLVRENVK